MYFKHITMIYKNKKNLLGKFKLLLFLGLGLFIFGCHQKVPQKILAQKLILNLGANPSTFNPILATDTASTAISGKIFSALFRFNSDLQPEPDLITTYNISTDKKIYTFYLKKNISWHDGYPFTAEDVVFTFNKILDPATNTVRRSMFVIDDTPVKFKDLDKYTVQAILPKPFSPFLTNVAFDIVPKHILETEDINTTSFNQHPIGTGPFKLKEFKTAQYVLLEKNEDYYGEVPRLEQILYKIIPDANTATVALEKKELHSNGLQPKDYQHFQKNPDFNVFKFYDLSYTYMGFNLTNEYFKNPLVRQAIAYAINKEIIVQKILKGFAQPVDIPSAPSSWAYPPENSIYKYPYNPEKSKKLLKQAGFIINKQTGYLERDGKEFEFTILTGKGNPIRKKTAEVIQQFLRQVGIKVNIRILEWASFVKILNEITVKKAFDAVILGWSLGIEPDSYEIWHSSQFPKGFNFVGYKNKMVDTWLIKGREELDLTERSTIYKQMYNQISKDLPYIFLYNQESIAAVNKQVKGLSKPGPAGLMNRIERVYLEQ